MPSRPFKAKYYGWCGWCRQEYFPGDTIVAMDNRRTIRIPGRYGGTHESLWYKGREFKGRSLMKRITVKFGHYSCWLKVKARREAKD